MSKGLVALLCGLVYASSGHAALFDRGSGLIYDDVLDITWLADANYAKTSGYDDDGLLTWQSAMDWVDTLTYHDAVRDVDYTDWRLPVSENICNLSGCFGSEMAHMYYTNLGGQAHVELATTHNDNYNLFHNINSPIDAAFWSSTVASTYPYLTVWAFDMDNGIESINGAPGPTGQGYLYAWVVRNGDVSPVPEPNTSLLVLGGLGLIGIRFYMRR